MIKVVYFTGSCPRHGYIARQLWEQGILVGIIQEQRLDFSPEAPTDLSGHMLHLWQHHFDQRQIMENRFFGNSWEELEAEILHHSATMINNNQNIIADSGANAGNKALPILKISSNATNSPEVVRFLQYFNPDFVISYGCHFINAATQQAVPNTTFWNIHGGLSPYYRGVTTHFWPSYFLEPQMTGLTLHYAQSRLDGGDILMQTVYTPHAEDTLHAVACRTVLDGGKQIATTLANLPENTIPEGSSQKTSGRLFVVSDWRPEHLRLIYDFYDDAIASEIVKGNLKGRVLENPINQLSMTLK